MSEIKKISAFEWANSEPVILGKHAIKNGAKKLKDIFVDESKDTVDIMKELASAKRKRLSEGPPKKKSKRVDISLESSNLDVDEDIDWSDCDEILSKSICQLDNSAGLSTDSPLSPASKDDNIKENKPVDISGLTNEEPDWSDCDEILSKSICQLDKSLNQSIATTNDEPDWSD